MVSAHGVGSPPPRHGEIRGGLSLCNIRSITRQIAPFPVNDSFAPVATRSMTR
jgi:hypothetical protein